MLQRCRKSSLRQSTGFEYTNLSYRSDSILVINSTNNRTNNETTHSEPSEGLPAYSRVSALTSARNLLRRLIDHYVLCNSNGKCETGHALRRENSHCSRFIIYNIPNYHLEWYRIGLVCQNQGQIRRFLKDATGRDYLQRRCANSLRAGLHLKA